MESRKFNFLAAVLGEDGALALEKAAERSSELGNALLPRSILAWIRTTSGRGFEGEIPGVPSTFIQFSKSTDGFSGSVEIGEEVYKFENASIFHLSASVAVAIGIEDERVAAGLRDLDLERLGKSIDLLAKARLVSRELVKAAEKVDLKGLPYECPGNKKECPNIDCKECSDRETLEKGKDGPGQAAGAVAATAPVAPAAPTGKAPAPVKGATVKLPSVAKPPKPASVKLTRSEAERKCQVCGIAQFKAEKFTGCICLRELCKGAKVTAVDASGFSIELGPDWDRESVVTLLEAVGRA